MSNWMMGVGLVAVTMALPAKASGTSYLGRHNAVNLSVPQNRVVVNIAYPGKLSGVCGVRVRFSRYWLDEGALKAIAGSLVVRDLVGMSGNVTLAPKVLPGAIGYELNASSLQKYLTLVTVESRNGSSLKSLFEKAAPNQGGLESEPLTAVLTATACP
jgi:hypothetical protein